MKFEVLGKVNLNKIKANAITIQDIQENKIILDNIFSRPDLFCQKYIKSGFKKETFIKAKDLEFKDLKFSQIKRKISTKVEYISKKSQAIIKFSKKSQDLEKYISNLKVYDKQILYLEVSENQIYINSISEIFFNLVYTLIYLFIENSEYPEVFCNIKPVSLKYTLNNEFIKKYFKTQVNIKDLEILDYKVDKNLIKPPLHRQDIKSIFFVLADLINLNFDNIEIKNYDIKTKTNRSYKFYNFLQNKGFRFIRNSNFIDFQTLKNIQVNQKDIQEYKIVINPISRNKKYIDKDLLGYLLKQSFVRQNQATPLKIFTINPFRSNKVQAILLSKNQNLIKIINQILPIKTQRILCSEINSEVSINCKSKDFKFKINILDQTVINKFKFRPETSILYLKQL